MVKLGGVQFTTPWLISTLRPMTQEIEVTTTHQRQAAAAQTDDAIADVVRFPARPSRNACFAHQALCDDTIRMAGKASIKRAENKPEPLPLSQRQPEQWPAGGPAAGKPPHAQRRFGTRNEIVVEWNDGGCGRRSVSSVAEDNGQTITTVVNEPVLAIDSTSGKCRCQRSERARSEHLRRRGDHYGGRIEMRQPNDGRATRW
jgi:hypothetical protein